LYFSCRRKDPFRSILLTILDDNFVPGVQADKKAKKVFKKPNSPNGFVNCSKMSDLEAGSLLQNLVTGQWDMIQFGKQCLSYKAKRTVRNQISEVLWSMMEEKDVQFEAKDLLDDDGKKLVWEKMVVILKNVTAPNFTSSWAGAADKLADGKSLGAQFIEQVRARLQLDNRAFIYVSC
jgi:hypothetical protein